MVVLGVVLVILAPLAFFVTKAIQQGIAIGQGLAGDGVSVRSLLDHVSGWAPIETLIGSPDVFETQAALDAKCRNGATTTIVGLAAHLPNIVLQLALASLAWLLSAGRWAPVPLRITDKIPSRPTSGCTWCSRFRRPPSP